MLTTLSLIAVFACSIFIVVCSILNKIELYPSTKGILCFIMLSTIGTMTKSFHSYAEVHDLLVVALSLFMIRQTYVGYKRGYL